MVLRATRQALVQARAACLQRLGRFRVELVRPPRGLEMFFEPTYVDEVRRMSTALFGFWAGGWLHWLQM